MIIVKLSGGLGNQMFQYARGFALARETGAKLILDVSEYHRRNRGSQTARKFELGIFNPQVPKYGQQRSERLLLRFLRMASLRTERYIKWQRIIPRLVVDSAGFEQNVESIQSPGVYLCGYWQNPAYFAGCEVDLREQFTFPLLTDPLDIALAAEIEACESVALHVRRGDYLKGNAVNIHGVCDHQFYIRALNVIMNKVRKPTVYVFSDDHAFVESEIKAACQIRFVKHNKGSGSFRDMQLMSICKHQIIANSTFSWWAAWLNTFQAKIVIAPEKWYSDPNLNNESNNLIPKNWLRV